VSDAGLSSRVQRFITAHIDSLEKLEVLLLLRNRAEREWTAAEVSQELRITESSASMRLMDLAGRGLLLDNRASPPAYRYSPADSEDVQSVTELAGVYGSKRVSVISFIFSRPLDKVRGFADAFLIKKDKDGGHG
jgi:predicted transcriptional regulator